MDIRLEVVVLPVSDVDRSKDFYVRLGWRLDADFVASDDFRVVQVTPPGSPCSVISVASIPQQVKDLRERQTRPAAAAGGLQHRSASSSGGLCDGALGDGGQPVAIWVRLDQLAAGDDEPLAGADDPGSGE